MRLPRVNSGSSEALHSSSTLRGSTEGVPACDPAYDSANDPLATPPVTILMTPPVTPSATPPATPSTPATPHPRDGAANEFNFGNVAPGRFPCLSPGMNDALAGGRAGRITPLASKVPLSGCPAKCCAGTRMALMAPTAPWGQVWLV